ncbi:MAG: VanZ family protein [Bacteroidetes bacterium]|nr:VanZ family protein [Bacteroidota bacterium]
MAPLKVRWLFLSVPVLGILLICLLIAIADIYSTDALRFGFTAMPGFDKLGHFFIYGIFAFSCSFFGRLSGVSLFRKPRTQTFITSLILAFAFVEEFTQLFLSTRSFELMDLVCDTTGILMGVKLGFRALKMVQ